MLVKLFTVRVILGILGVEDYGIYNIVGSVVIIFTFMNSGMTSATQRFLNFAIGQNDFKQARNVFSISFIIHIIIALLVVIFAETIGLWFFFTWLNIPADRQSAAFIVYQFSVLTTVICIIQVPYLSVIIAHEKMSFFALLSIIEVLLRLGSVFLLEIIFFDKLIVYAFLFFIITLIIFFLHKIYCNKVFETARFHFCKDKKLLKHLAEFSGWTIFGQFTGASRTHGINILINIFNGVAVNAAMGLATQINSAVFTFVTNFQTAFRPQIIKSYATKNYDYFIKLIFRTSKISFYMLLFLIMPLYLNADFVLQIWLKNVPDYTFVFTKIILLHSLIEAIAGPLWMSIQATGDIKKYQIVISCFAITNLLLTLIFLLLGYSPVWVLIIKIFISVITLFWRIFFLRDRINLPVLKFFREVITPIILITVISGLINILLINFFFEWVKLIFTCIVSTISIGCLIYFIGINSDEKILLRNWINRLIKRTENPI